MTAEARGPYRHFIFDLRLPFRIFLDDAVYTVRVDGTRWKVSLRSEPTTEIPSSAMALRFGRRDQWRLDSHGYSGRSIARVACPLDPPATADEVHARQTSDAKISVEDALRPINRLIALYRAKTDEFWFRPIARSDVPVVVQYVLPVGSRTPEFFAFMVDQELAGGTPYLKSDDWYDDLGARLDREEEPPFHLELRHEARDALARANFRLAAADFALAVEALFRALLLELFPDADVRRPVQQMLGTFFGRYHEVGDPAQLPLTKRDAMRRLKTVWDARDELLHAHDVTLTAEAVTRVSRATDELFALWDARPGAQPLMIQGPFVGGSVLTARDFPSRDPGTMIRRALTRLATGHLDDAEEAARYALVLDRHAVHPRMILGGVAARRKNYEAAAAHYRQVLEIDPQHDVAAANLERCIELSSSRPSERSQEGE